MLAYLHKGKKTFWYVFYLKSFHLLHLVNGIRFHNSEECREGEVIFVMRYLQITFSPWIVRFSQERSLQST